MTTNTNSELEEEIRLTDLLNSIIHVEKIVGCKVRMEFHGQESLLIIIIPADVDHLRHVQERSWVEKKVRVKT